MIYVTQITKSRIFHFIFTHDECFLQEISSKILVSLIDSNHCLCYISRISITSQLDTKVLHPFLLSLIKFLHTLIMSHCLLLVNYIWHSRLGHHSYQRMQLLDCCYVDSNEMKNCTVCFEAKQRKLAFPVSITVTTSIFSLIHVDVRGPYSVLLLMVTNIFSL